MQRTFFDESTDTSISPFSSLCERLGVTDGPNWADGFGKALRAWSGRSALQSIRTLSLFSGVGGLDIAFHDAGFRVETAVEIDERFVATLRANATSGGHLEGTNVLRLDVRHYHPDPGTSVDFVLGGPPCQSFSAAGRRAAGVDGTKVDRGTLFREYVRLLKRLNPQGFLFENVYGITGAEGGSAWEMIRRAFEDAGYSISSRILDAADYGVPQHRERMFIVGVRDGKFSFPAPTHGPDSVEGRPFISAASAIDSAPITDQERLFVLGGRYGHLLREIPDGLNYSFFTEKMGHPRPIFAWRSKFSDFLYKADPETPIRTLKAQGGQCTGPFHWDNRPFSLGELKRLQSIPDDYQIIGSRQVAIHQIGNSVPTQLARILAISILTQVFKAPIDCEIPLLEEGSRLGFRKRKRHLTEIYRSKAAHALDARPSDSIDPVVPGWETRAYPARLTEDFGWLAEEGMDAPLFVQVALDADEWQFRVDAGSPKPIGSGHTFKVILTSTPRRPWALGAKTITLLGGSRQSGVFTGLWKAFERECRESDLKADLVQLCEYYQYPPRFSAEMTYAAQPDGERWPILRDVLAGVGTRRISTAEELAKHWKCGVEDILGHAIWLRTLGYEVRNHRTNRQIPEGSYLIPYAFPTLTPSSVQLRKSLVDAK